MIIGNTAFTNNYSQIVVRIGKFQRMSILPHRKTFKGQKKAMIHALYELAWKVQTLKSNDKY